MSFTIPAETITPPDVVSHGHAVNWTQDPDGTVRILVDSAEVGVVPPTTPPAPPPATTGPYVHQAKQMLESPASWTDLEAQAVHYDHLVLQHWQTGFAARAKAANPKIKVFAYQNATYARPGSPSSCSCGLDLTTATNDGYATGLTTSWGLTLCDITKPGYAAAWISAVTARLAGLGFDGIYLDDFNVEAVAPSLPSGVSAAQWSAALSSFVQAVRAATQGKYLLVANMNGTWGQHPAITPLLQYLDGGYDEFDLDWPAGQPVSQGFIDNALAAMATARGTGKLFLSNTVCSGTADTKRALAGYCLALIGGASHHSLITNLSDIYDSPTIWLPQFGQDIGLPLAAYTKSGTVYTRKFEKATITVDVATMTGSIV